jgi:hypothetical protein
VFVYLEKEHIVTVSVLNMHLYRGFNEQGSTIVLNIGLKHQCVYLVTLHKLNLVVWLTLLLLKPEFEVQTSSKLMCSPKKHEIISEGGSRLLQIYSHGDA